MALLITLVLVALLSYSFFETRKNGLKGLAGAQGVDVTRAAQVGGARGGVGQRADRGRAVVDRDARGAPLAQQIDRDGERGAQQRGVVGLHHVEFELGATLLRKRCAEHAAALLEHEVDDLGGDLLGGDDEVALVLAVFVVDDDHHLAVADRKSVV